MTKLPDAELDILAALVRCGEATARDLREQIAGYRSMAHGSTVTLLNRLEEKGLVTKRKGDVGKAFVYRPTPAGRRAIKPVVNHLLERVFAGDRTRFVASIFDGPTPTTDEIKDLEALIDTLRTKRRKSGG